MFPDASVNQQQFPEGSKASAFGVLLAVGIVHSVKVAVVTAETGFTAINDGSSRINDKTIIVLPRSFGLTTTWGRLETNKLMTPVIFRNLAISYFLSE